MGVRPITSIVFAKTLVLLFVLILVAIFLIKAPATSSSFQEPAEKSQEIKETVLDDQIPRHVPIKIKIKKEKEAAFKDLKNERWARDFELEVTNTGNKPIYSLSLMLVTDLKAAAGFRVIAPLDFGRIELGDIRVQAQPNDVAILPGDSYILKIHSGQLSAWETIQRKEHRPHPKKILVKFEALSFGDGTGYVGEDGQAIPGKQDRTGVQGKCVDWSEILIPYYSPPVPQRTSLLSWFESYRQNSCRLIILRHHYREVLLTLRVHCLRRTVVPVAIALLSFEVRGSGHGKACSTHEPSRSRFPVTRSPLPLNNSASTQCKNFCKNVVCPCKSFCISTRPQGPRSTVNARTLA